MKICCTPSAASKTPGRLLAVVLACALSAAPAMTTTVTAPDTTGDPGAIEAALEWLANHQELNGSWDSNGFMLRDDPDLGPISDGPGAAGNDVGVTALALLTFLGAGNTHQAGPHKRVVMRAARYLQSVQNDDGRFGIQAGAQSVYGHAIATLALCELYALTNAKIWQPAAQNGVSWILKAQNPYKAWRYGVRPGDNDMSITAWMVMALHAARVAKLEVEDKAFEWALGFIDEITDEETGRTGYTRKGELPVRNPGTAKTHPAKLSESMTAAAILSRVWLGQKPSEEEVIKKGLNLIGAKLPEWNTRTGVIDPIYWYFASLANFQAGGEHWKRWNGPLKKAALAGQRKDGNFAGSWDPVGPWGKQSGRVGTTALMAMNLMVVYRYARVTGTR